MTDGLKEYPDGTKVWYLNSVWHREDGPAVEHLNGDKIWYLYGKLHREDGPAVEWASGGIEWYLNNKEYSEKNYYKELYKRGLIDVKQLVLELL